MLCCGFVGITDLDYCFFVMFCNLNFGHVIDYYAVDMLGVKVDCEVLGELIRLA